MVYEETVMEDINKYINKLIDHCKSTPCIDCKYVKVGCWRERVVPAVWTDKRNTDIKYVKALLTMYEMIKKDK